MHVAALVGVAAGKPKAVQVTNGNLSAFLAWLVNAYPMDGATLLKTATSFDVFYFDLLWPLVCGGRLVVADPHGHRDPDYVVNAVQRFGITGIHFVPSQLGPYRVLSR